MTAQTGRLAGKIALITGIGAGIGKGCALLFAREGARVIGVDINAERAAATAVEAKDAGSSLQVAAPIDLTKPDEVARVVRDSVDHHGRIDIVVNAGAINPQFAPVAQMSYENIWRPTLIGEADIVFLMCREVWPHLIAGGGGSIVNFASVAAHRGTHFAGMLAHSAGKGAVLAMTRQLAVEGAPHRIRANSISPGLVATMATASQGLVEGQASERVAAATPLGRIGQPRDIAYCALYLACDESGWVTGADVSVDGGVLAS